jgi:hypothetical protein
MKTVDWLLSLFAFHRTDLKRPSRSSGAVLETIMSVMHGTKGDRICAGIGRIHVRINRRHANLFLGLDLELPYY